MEMVAFYFFGSKGVGLKRSGSQIPKTFAAA
jgi:hypothetical protein